MSTGVRVDLLKEWPGGGIQVGISPGQVDQVKEGLTFLAASSTLGDAYAHKCQDPINLMHQPSFDPGTLRHPLGDTSNSPKSRTWLRPTGITHIYTADQWTAAEMQTGISLQRTPFYQSGNAYRCSS
jgi:hypothetical protein